MGIQIDPRKFDAINRIDMSGNPDFTLTKVNVDCCWGPWDREDVLQNNGGISVEWESVSAGCGRIELYTDADGSLRKMTQGMGDKFCSEVFLKLFEQAKEK